MKVLSITPFLRGAPFHPASGGKSAISLKVTNALLDEGHEVYVLPWSKEYIHEETPFLTDGESNRAIGLPTMFIPGVGRLTKRVAKALLNPSSWKNPKLTIWTEFQEGIYDKRYFLNQAMKRTRPDLVHAHYTHSDIAKIYREGGYSTPFILTHHSKGVSESIPDYDHVVFISQFQYEEARSVYPDVEHRHSVIHNCVDTAYLDPVDPKESNKVLFLSNLKRGKGLDILLEAFAVNSEMAKYELDVIGEGEMLPASEEFVKKQNLKNISFHGRLSLEENIHRMEESSLFVVPSRGEGFGVIYIEALCSGLPVIGFPNSIRELNELMDMQVGFEFDADHDSPNYLSELIQKAMTTELTTLQYRKELMQKARELFSFDTFKNRYLEVYEKLMP